MKKKQVLRIVVLLAAAGVAFVLKETGIVGQNASNQTTPDADRSIVDTQTTEASDRIQRAIENEESGVMVVSAGIVVKSLPDDNDGSRHQRFIVKLASGRTILIAHNIDLAPSVPLNEMDIVEFRGQFEWNDRGGVVHWTHHDPGGRREGGWIRHNGTLYK